MPDTFRNSETDDTVKDPIPGPMTWPKEDGAATPVTSEGSFTWHRIRALEMAIDIYLKVPTVHAPFSDEDVVKTARTFHEFLCGDDKLTPAQVDALPKSE